MWERGVGAIETNKILVDWKLILECFVRWSRPPTFALRATGTWTRPDGFRRGRVPQISVIALGNYLRHRLLLPMLPNRCLS
jgi:hypothetical protein